MASSDTLHAKPTAPEQTEPVDGLERVMGTGRIESACGTEKRAHGPLVNSNQERGNEAHGLFIYRSVEDRVQLAGRLRPVTLFHRALRLSRSSAPVASRARCRALTIRSTAGSSCWCRRNDSRIILRIRFRCTPPPAVRTATARPRRGQPWSFQKAVTPKNPLPKRRPRAYAASKSDLRRMRFCAGRVSLLRAAHSPPVKAII
jgi:hypothetical protein